MVALPFPLDGDTLDIQGQLSEIVQLPMPESEKVVLPAGYVTVLFVGETETLQVWVGAV